MNEHDAWDEAERVTKRHSIGKFGRLDDGKSCTGAFVEGPSALETHWTPTGSVRCDGSGCVLCAKGNPVKARVRINFFDLSDNVMRIWEGTPSLLRDLKMLKKKCNFAETAFEITRSGMGKNTKYLILPDRPLTSEQKALIAKASPHNLTQQGDDLYEPEAASTAPTASTPPPTTAAAPEAKQPTGTIATKVRDEFITRLQALRNEQALYDFLGAFHCERISDVPAADEGRARQMLEALERKKSEIDPFS